jgi:transcriptional regulator with XRE-family HTH domain
MADNVPPAKSLEIAAMKRGSKTGRRTATVIRASSDQVSETSEEAAERRRKALRAILDERGLTLKDAAHAAGIGSASALGNFLNGVTASLNVATLEPLARALNVSINRLVGQPEIKVISKKEAYICGAIATGRWRRDHLWPRDKWLTVVVPDQVANYRTSRFLRLESTEMNILYAPGTIFEVVDLSEFTDKLPTGCRVIVTRTNPEGFVENSIRQIERIDDNEVQLIARSNDPLFADRAIPFTWPIEPGCIEEAPNGDRVQVRAVVVLSIQEEINLSRRN